MFRLLIMMFLGAVLSPVPGWAQPPANPRPPVILAHYMPWFEARPSEKFWGWHWTMNHFDSEQIVDGKRSIVAHLYPEIGPYDSGDVDVIEYHLLTMKLAGIDGVIIDWYGLQDFRDYALLHRNTMKLIAQCQRLGMQFAICYEDQTIPALVEGGKLPGDQRIPHAQRELQWLAEHWFVLPGYVRMNDKPMLLSFGSQGLSNEEWSQCFSRWKTPVTYLSLHFRRPVAAGVFDWPVPQQGLNAVDRFYKETPAEAAKVPVVFPRFQDIYQEAKLHDSYGRMDDADGKTFQDLLNRALSSRASVIQLATWNDWGGRNSHRAEPRIWLSGSGTFAATAPKSQGVNPQFYPRRFAVTARIIRPPKDRDDDCGRHAPGRDHNAVGNRQTDCRANGARQDEVAD